MELMEFDARVLVIYNISFPPSLLFFWHPSPPVPKSLSLHVSKFQGPKSRTQSPESHHLIPTMAPTARPARVM